MSRRDDTTLLRDMIEAARAAIAAIEGKDRSAIVADHVFALGLVKCLEIVGEAARQLSAELTDRHPEVPWPQIVAMRHRLVHAYFEIDYEQVWKALTDDLPPLIAELERILGSQARGAQG